MFAILPFILIILNTNIVKSIFSNIPFEKNIQKLIQESIYRENEYKDDPSFKLDYNPADRDPQSKTDLLQSANYMRFPLEIKSDRLKESQEPVPKRNDPFFNKYPAIMDMDITTSSPKHDETVNSQEPAEPIYPPTFQGIYDARDNFDVETPMEFPSESKPDSEELYDKTDDYASESQSTNSLLTDGCLRCICEASSDCDPRVRCHVVGPVDYYCGPFQINTNYWDDAGRPGSDQHDPLDFEACMNDLECSIDTVNGYMTKYGRDCDGDGKLSCYDYARIHKGGPLSCNKTWVVNTPFWSKFNDCYFEY